MSIDTKEMILKKARKLFAKHGFDGVSIRTICQKASCNVSAISYHFGSKDELYRACLAEGGTNILQLMESILLPIENEADFKVKIRLFMIQLFEYSANNRELILMISKDANSKLTMEIISKIFEIIPEKLTEFFQDGINKGVIRKEIDPSFLAGLIVEPSFMQILFAESNRSKSQKNVADPQYRNYFIDQQLLTLFNGVLQS